MGAGSEILSELVHNPGARVITFSLNVQTFLCFSGTLVPRGLHVQRTTCTVSDHSCSCERPDGPLHVQALTVQKARCTVRARRHFQQRWLQHRPWGNATKGYKLTLCLQGFRNFCLKMVNKFRRRGYFNSFGHSVTCPGRAKNPSHSSTRVI